MTALLLLALTASGAEPWERDGWGFGALPAANYNTDEGFGFGAVGSAYRYDGETRPYALGATLLLFASTRGVHSHRLDLDFVGLARDRLRLTTRLELDATTTSNFCGVGHAVACDRDLAEEAADGMQGEARAEFVRRYYLVRYLRPNAFVNARWKIGVPGVEVMAGWRGEMLVPGTFGQSGPYPGSYYEEEIGAERGLSSVVQAGLMYDTRDNEPSPHRGVWAEVSIRGTTPGSAWHHGGANLTFRGYLPLAEHLTLASRTVLDGLVGDAHVVDLARPGGSQIYSMGGGAAAGRGIRLRRYIGRARAMEQLELRWAFARFDVAKVPVELTALAFVDALTAAAEWDDLDEALAHPVFGEGVGLRVALEENFVVRVDIGVSAVEDWAPKLYIDLANLF